ncbi:2814_t:CDS:2, partial [Acaulospora morrowiae]
PIDGSNNKFEINDVIPVEIFGKLCELKRKNGYDLGRHIGNFHESSAAEEIPLFSENAASFRDSLESSAVEEILIFSEDATAFRDSLESSAVEEILIFSEDAAAFRDSHEPPNPNPVDSEHVFVTHESHELLNTNPEHSSTTDEFQEFIDYPNTIIEYESINQ